MVRDSDDEELANTKNSNHIANDAYDNGSELSSLTLSDMPGERDALLYYLDNSTATYIFRVGDVLSKVSSYVRLCRND